MECVSVITRIHVTASKIVEPVIATIVRTAIDKARKKYCNLEKCFIVNSECRWGQRAVNHSPLSLHFMSLLILCLLESILRKKQQANALNRVVADELKYPTAPGYRKDFSPYLVMFLL